MLRLPVQRFVYSFPAAGTFQLEIIFSNEYPNRPPVVRFLSKLFHPNVQVVDCAVERAAIEFVISNSAVRGVCAYSVYNDGNICLDILQTQWSPIYDISAILTSIQ
ncbi:UNVERIFIED_CONTAM: hypothetical protein H355_009091, partial [Colinus virginianus]